MGIDLDPLDEILSDRAPSIARAGVRFQPKAKPRPRKESSAPILSTQSVEAVDIVENGLSSLVSPSLASSETLDTKKSLKNNEDCVSGVHSPNDSALVNPSLEHVVIKETLGCSAGLHPEVVIHDVNRDWHPTIGKSVGESADIFFGLESLDEFYSQSTTATVSAVEKNDLRVQLGNEFAKACPVSNEAEGCSAPSEMPNIHVSDSRSTAEEGPLIAVVSAFDDSSVRISNFSSSYPCPEVTISQDPLTCGEAVVSNSDGGFHINNQKLEIEEAYANPCLETLDNLYDLTTRSGLQSGKFQSKPKAQIDREKHGANTSHSDGDDSIPCYQDGPSVPSESEFINEGSMPVFPSNNLLNSSSLRFGGSTSELPENEERMNLAQTSHSDTFFPGGNPKAAPEILEKVSPSAENRKRKPLKVSDDSLEQQQASISGHEDEACRSTRQLRKRINECELVDESEDEDHGDGNFTIESSCCSLLDEDVNGDGEYQVLSETRNRRGPRICNKAAPQKEKPIRKRKKANEVPDQATKGPPKKFSHSTRRKRRQVDKVLLETPEDEIDFEKLRIRDLILLAEHREQISSKEGKTSEVPLSSTNQSAGNSFINYNEGEASEQGGSSNHPTNPTVQESSTFTNYQSYMNKTPRSRWSKQDTELFYEAVLQFGSDISMIQQLFPGRTRNQVKLKYKKEERQHPLRLHEALTTRAKDHSHFQLVIERLQQIAAQEKQNSGREDSIEFTGDEVEVNPEINEEVAKPELAKEGKVEAKEPEVSEVRSPLKSDDSEDDLCRWSRYISEL